jgi:hypothetical protein
MPSDSASRHSIRFACRFLRCEVPTGFFMIGRGRRGPLPLPPLPAAAAPLPLPPPPLLARSSEPPRSMEARRRPMSSERREENEREMEPLRSTDAARPTLPPPLPLPLWVLPSGEEPTSSEKGLWGEGERP